MSVDVLAALEESMREIDARDAGQPWPWQEHSAYADQGALIRREMALGWQTMRVGTSALLRHSDVRLMGETFELGTYELRVGLCGGRAPYVGRPFHYEWDFACDILGRWVGGPTRIVYDEEGE